jgi:hypothetical protein
MFKIDIANAEEFSAIVISSPFGVTDTVFALFDSTGLGVYLNDDISGADTLSCLPSTVANPCLTALPPGGWSHRGGCLLSGDQPVGELSYQRHLKRILLASVFH